MQRLRAAIPAVRIARYDAACAGTQVDPMDLYRWSGAVALAMFDDLSNLEVSMRSAMASQLAAAYGLEWYTRTDVLDDDTLKLVDAAWRVGKLGKLNADLQVVHGKLVATLMFGFWVKILGRGGYQGKSPNRQRRIYDTLLWKPALRNAFPNAGGLDRAAVEKAARRVQALRNRIAHHEHIVWGVPLAGEKRQDGTAVRLSVSEVHGTLLTLAGYIDRDLEGWLRQYSTVNEQLSLCPLPGHVGLLI